MKRAATSDLFVILSLVLIAAFFRFYRLHEWPIGLWRDEAANGLEALRVLEGHLATFYGTREPMFIYLLAPSVAFLGRNPLAIRIVAALAGTATIPITYLLVKEVFQKTDYSPRIVACLTSFWLGTSYWHLNFSRLGFRGVLLPLCASLCFCLFWRGWNKLEHETSPPRWSLPWFAVAGLIFGLTFYTYTPARFLLVILLPFFGHALWRTLGPRAGVQRNTAPHACRLAPLGVFALCFVFAFAPLGMHFLAEPQSLWARSGISVFSTVNEKPLASLLIENTLRQLGMFGFTSDPNTRHNPAGRPAFDLITLAFFAVGFLLSLRHWKKMPYLFCIVWFLAMQIPPILTYPELPHSLRAIGALPIAYVFPALGMDASWRWLRHRVLSPNARRGLAVVFGLCLMLIASISFRDYFAPRVEEIELVKAFDPRFVEIASTMNELDIPDAVWLIPVGPHDEQRMAYFVIDFLYQGRAPHRYVRVDKASAALDLTEACRGAERAFLLQRTGDWPAQPWHELYADWRGLLAFLLEKHGQQVEALEFDGFQVLVYQLPNDVTFFFPLKLRPVNLGFGQRVGLSAAAVGFGTAGSGRGWVALRWREEEDPEVGYAVQVALVGQSGHRVASVDRQLLSAQLHTTRLWQPGQQETGYYAFQGLPQPPGDGYNLEVSLYPGAVESGTAAPSATAGEKRTFVAGTVSASGELLDQGPTVGKRTAR